MQYAVRGPIPQRAAELARTTSLDLLMIRYNAAHPGAEADIFPHLPDGRHTVIAYTATCWRRLLKRPKGWEGKVPTAADCYRFCLSPPHVDVVLTGPKTVAQLREIAKEGEHYAVQGYSTMHKEQLIPALCEAFGIEAHVHHEVVGIDKAAVKAKIAELKKSRAEALAAGDKEQLHLIRRRIHHLKRRIRKATV